MLARLPGGEQEWVRDKYPLRFTSRRPLPSQWIIRGPRMYNPHPFLVRGLDSGRSSPKEDLGCALGCPANRSSCLWMRSAQNPCPSLTSFLEFCSLEERLGCVQVLRHSWADLACYPNISLVRLERPRNLHG